MSSAVPGISPDLTTILSQSGAEFGEMFSQPDLASLWMLNNPAMLHGNPFSGGFPQMPLNSCFNGLSGTGCKQQKGEDLAGFDPMQFGGANQVNWLQVLNLMNLNKKQDNMLTFPNMPLFDNQAFSRSNNQLNHHQLVSTQQRSTSAMTSSPELSSSTSVVESQQQPPIVTNSNGKRVVTPKNNSLLESSVGKIRLHSRLSGATHHQVAAEGCRWTVNLPKGHISSTEIEVKKDDSGDEYLEVTCGDNNALLYIARLCQGSKGKSILYELGGKQSWMHPNEFQAISGRETAKDWKRSIRHHGKSLKALMSKSVIIYHQNDCECKWCLQNTSLSTDRHAEKSTDDTNKISHIFPSTLNNHHQDHDDVTTWQPFVSLPNNFKMSPSPVVGYTTGSSPSPMKVNESTTRNSAFTCVRPTTKNASQSATKIDSQQKSPPYKSAKHHENSQISTANSTLLRKRSHNDTNLGGGKNQIESQKEVIEGFPVAKKKLNSQNECSLILNGNPVTSNYNKFMLDQSNLVQNMAAAFGQLAPNLLENLKISCKSQMQDEFSQSNRQESSELLHQENCLNTSNDINCRENSFRSKEFGKLKDSNEMIIKKRSNSVPLNRKDTAKKPRVSYSLNNLNTVSDVVTLNQCNLILSEKSPQSITPVSETSTKVASIMEEMFKGKSIKSADEVTMRTILKHVDEMNKWSCERVGQYLDEIELGQYKEIFLDNGINGHSLPFIREESCMSRLQMKLGHAHTLISSVHRRLGSYVFILEAHHSPSSPLHSSG